MTNESKYPLPLEDDHNRVFLSAWREGRLSLPHCTSCNKTFYYPRLHCPFCWSDEIVWKDMSGEATIVSFSLVYRPNDASFNDEIPIVLAEVKLKEGITMIARVIADAEHVASGQTLKLVSGTSVLTYPLPTFERS